MSPLTEPTRIVLRNGWQPMDPDAAAYITAVETADGQALEEPVKIAIDNFVLGCKADGIWNAIKASCILAGARTLNGALVPLTGTAPTNYNFVSGDYNRKTGLVGDASTKYLNSNRNNNADPQNSNHNAVYVTAAQTTGVGLYMATTFDLGTNNLGQNASPQEVFFRSRNSFSAAAVYAGLFTGFLGHSRNSSSGLFVRLGSTTYPETVVSQTPLNENINIYRRGTANYADARLAFYSIGESLNLALLDARVTDLINKFAEVIP